MRRTIVVAVALVVPACAFFAGVDDLSVGPCKGGPCPDASTPEERPAPDVFVPPPADDAEAPCPGKPMPAAVRVGAAGNRFCIDTTEVTRAQYQQFLDAKVDPASQPPACVWNTSFAPEEPDAGPDQPITSVDWCDALAYCTWSGKYLCGKAESGKKTGPVTHDGLADFHSNEWMIACSLEGHRQYSYEGVFDPAKCNVMEFDAGGTVSAGSLPKCVGGYPGVFDMIGNVWEWFDGPCDPDGTLEVEGGDGGPASDNCIVKGGSWANGGPSFDCRLDAPGIRRDQHAPWLGFRCCSD